MHCGVFTRYKLGRDSGGIEIAFLRGSKQKEMGRAAEYRPYPARADAGVLAKQELRSGRLVRGSRSGSAAASRACGDSDSRFDLSASQAFIAAFMSPLTPYRSMLLYHGVGVGKTCAAIQVAEAHGGLKHALVIVPQTTKAGFKSNVVETRRTPLTEQGFVDLPAQARRSCTGMAYTAASQGRQLSRADFRAAAQQRISTRYRFFGYEQFVNSFDAALARVRDRFAGAAEADVRRDEDAVIRAVYGRRVIIVDEAHNLRESNSSGAKGILDRLRRVAAVAPGVRLILMSATPMYNRHEEIVDLLNLLLLNDGQPELRGELFDKGGALTPEGERRLGEAAFGRVSYMRGDNPDTFPLRLTSAAAGLTRPPPPAAVDVNGHAIQPARRLRTEQLHFSVLSPLQARLYDALTPTGGYDSSVRWSSTFQQHCNVSFGDEAVGEEGFRKAFRVRGDDSVMRVSYRGAPLLSPELLARHAPKMAAVVASVKRCDGSAFVFSRYKWSGVIPLAIALEEEGFLPIRGRPLLESAARAAGGADAAPRYAMITSDENFTATGVSVGEIVARLNDPGSGLRVVLGTLKASEGLDFKGVREVHVLDPWHHMNVTEQIVGRCVRYCSHTALPEEKRNVTVFLHCAAFSLDAGRRETNDEYMYRTAFRKLARVGEVSRVLKRNAIDCPVVRESLYIPPRGLRAVLTSQGRRVRVPVGDQDGSAVCDYGKCGFPCAPAAAARGPVDASTFHPYFVRHAVEMAAWDAVAALESAGALTFEELWDRVDVEDEAVLALALQSLLNPLLCGKWTGDRLVVQAGPSYVLVPAAIAATNSVFTMAEVQAGALSLVPAENVLHPA